MWSFFQPRPGVDGDATDRAQRVLSRKVPAFTKNAPVKSLPSLISSIPEPALIS
jgi:hypothetical protein